MPRFSLSAGFVVERQLAMPLCHLGSTEEGVSWEYMRAYHKLRTQRKCLGKRS